jgi:nitrogenase molybdenum-cofactor synthesis protein NifE
MEDKIMFNGYRATRDKSLPQLLKARTNHVQVVSEQTTTLACDKPSLAGSVSQRACVFCGSRVVLYPIADAIHLVHGPIGCAAYTWDIRGALSSGPELHRLSFSTDLQEQDVIFGGESKLQMAIYELATQYSPQAVFVYSTCIIGLIGDDVTAVCKQAQQELRIPVIPVHSEGFKGTKKDGYKAACEALMKIIGTEPDGHEPVPCLGINILGEFNLAGEAWQIKQYYAELGITVLCTLTGDSRIHEIQKAHRAALNVVQCSGSMTSLAKMMQAKYGIPFIHVSYFGLEDMSEAIYEVARFFKDEPDLLCKAVTLVKRELTGLLPRLAFYKSELSGKKAAIYVGGAFKAQSLVKALRHIGMETVLVGSQTGNKEDYAALEQLCAPGTIIVDDSNPVELSRFLIEQQADIFIGGVKERPVAYKLGIGFCDHNHERKIALAGYAGMLNFAREVYASVMSPVWGFVRALRENAWLESNEGNSITGEKHDYSI